ncbi:hypothetical protein SLEP1_g4532 [Rubroshorea leprosula]|uniref:Uncharacterized protein n=1 Tax=Rubroshorea leprosula TaxID=152421 RepID=A0AAV5HNZ6_9ROSI|nr:hypothetical protein SLEP1_g4532 [Rubroshorea leprosula]
MVPGRARQDPCLQGQVGADGYTHFLPCGSIRCLQPVGELWRRFCESPEGYRKQSKEVEDYLY